ncbi:hypothetical protein ACEQ8H_007888 [Pleosporales sp. CAS-2024a]
MAPSIARTRLSTPHDTATPRARAYCHQQPKWRSKPDHAAAGAVTRRAPTLAQSNKGRLPYGTPAHNDTAAHSHIRVVPRADTDQDPADSASSANTFADMARRFRPSDSGTSSEHSSLHSTAAIVTLPPHRKIGRDPWRPEQPSELSIACENASSTAENMERLLHVGDAPPPTFLATSPQALRYKQSPPELLHVAQGMPQGLAIEQAHAAPAPTELPPHADDRYAELFGQLPDQIFLHEQLGEFDGQVIFIGHPNRDVSAHQWSSASFQWENIGRYSHSRAKVEGSLASERVLGLNLRRDALLHFKLAAEDREKHVTQKEHPQEASGMLRAMHANVVCTSEAPHSSTTIKQDVQEHSEGHVHVGRGPAELITSDSDVQRGLMNKELLDDPFVAKPNHEQAKVASRTVPGTSLKDNKGSLDLRYKFPGSTYTPTELTVEDARRKHQELASSRYATQVTEVRLRDIMFGEEAASAPGNSDGQNKLPDSAALPSSPDTGEALLRPGRRAYAKTEYVKPPRAAVQGRFMPIFEASLPTARSLFPAPGLTVANPYRAVSHLNTATSPEPRASSQVPQLSLPNVDHRGLATLQYSDPDIVRHGQEYEITNGLSQQAPTPQNFKGPFFTASKPTANNPTASLSASVSEEEKMRTWYRDGHRPARQRDYAQSLMSTAALSSRNRHHLGTVGAAGTSKTSDTLNTILFVRLYECLSEYAEERRNDGGRFYFTSAWKAAPPDLRDLGPDGNRSFFSNTGTVPGNSHTYAASTYRKDKNRDIAEFVPSSSIMVYPPYGSVGDKRY